MKALFTIMMALQLLFESAGAVAMILFRGQLAPEAAQSEHYLMVTMGFVALTMAIMTVVAWLQRTNAAVRGFALVLFSMYHSMVFLGALLIAAMGADISNYVAHLVIALGFWVVYFNRQKLIL